MKCKQQHKQIAAKSQKIKTMIKDCDGDDAQLHTSYFGPVRPHTTHTYIYENEYL